MRMWAVGAPPTAADGSDATKAPQPASQHHGFELPKALGALAGSESASATQLWILACDRTNSRFSVQGSCQSAVAAPKGAPFAAPTPATVRELHNFCVATKHRLNHNLQPSEPSVVPMRDEAARRTTATRVAAIDPEGRGWFRACAARSLVAGSATRGTGSCWDDHVDAFRHVVPRY